MTEKIRLILIPLLPLVGFLINGLGYKKLPKAFTGFLGSGVVLLSFILSISVFFDVKENASKAFIIPMFDWINAGAFNISFSFMIDPLSSVMLLVITGVGFLIHLYSIGYMHEDKGYGRYFAYLNLFIFFMLILVLGSNYAIMFIGWEGVGLCSYLLIGFWFKNPEYCNAAKKAFIMNRIGDLGFLLGIYLIFQTFGSVEYSSVFTKAESMEIGDKTLIAITLLLLVGAIGKSAQIPLHTWLPDAMAGPTPVSALIHAATMVTAGIYMISRSNILYILSPVSMAIIAGIGLVTALFAATIAITQNDIKKILAYSTLSQLGYMFLGLGTGAFTAAFFHVITHAFFKALLFLGAGSVIHAMSGEQDIRKMGGLKKLIPVTQITMFIGTLAIAGIPPLSGFFSKDEILTQVYNINPRIWGLGVIGAALTSFYMFRMYYLTFYGSFRGKEIQKKHIHESPRTMTFPLVVLAFMAIFSGFIGIPHVIADIFGFNGKSHLLSSFLAPVFSRSEMMLHRHEINHVTEYILIITSVFVSLLAILYCYIKYVKNKALPLAEGEFRSIIQKLSYNKFYVDEIYDSLIKSPLNMLSIAFREIDRQIVDKIIDGFGLLTLWLSRILRFLQSGALGNYLMLMAAAVAAILLINIFI